MVLSKKELISRANLYAENREKNMTNNNSTDAVDPENMTTDKLQDPMSGYSRADALSSRKLPTSETHGSERLRDPMSGYAGADAMRSDEKTEEADADRIHTEESKDSMSGYASADALDTNQK